MNREEAIEILKDTLYDEKTPTDYLEAVRMGREALENQKTGHWIKQEDGTYKCSNCKKYELWEGIYCASCGAKMEGE